MNAELLQKIQRAEPQYSEEWHMLSEICKSPGYHTRIPDGVAVHKTVTAVSYAHAIFASGEKSLFPRAEQVIRAVLALQSVDPYDATFGIWPWFAEEPVEKMAPPDWNWAGFIGAPICHMLQEYPHCLTAELKRDMTAALERAAWCIFRRNMNPGYTNIALMGAAVTSCASEILGNSLLRQYARSRIRHFLEYTRKEGGFNEYNSPTYTFVALSEIERILQLAKDPETLEYAEQLRYEAWKMLAEHFHPATGQLCGPHSRAYADLLQHEIRERIIRMTGTEIFLPANQPSRPPDQFVFDGLKHLPCPEDLKPFFTPQHMEFSCTRRFVKRESDADSIYGNTWIHGDVSLGSASRECLWNQRRPLLGYWRNGENVAVFRAVCLKNGRDFASMGIRSVQDGGSVLSAFFGLTQNGDFHLSLDVPPGRRFPVRSLVLRYRVTAPGARAVPVSEGVYALECGPYKAVVRFPEAAEMNFAGGSIGFRCGTGEGEAYADLICCGEPERELVFDDTLTMKLAAAAEIIGTDQPVANDRPRFTAGPAVEWRGMRTIVSGSEPYNPDRR